MRKLLVCALILMRAHVRVRKFVLEILAHLNDLYFCLHSLMKDVSMRKGSLVCAYAAPRRAAKKFVYVIGGSHRELGSAWTKEEYTYDSVERYDIYAKQWRQVRKKNVFVFSSQPLLAEQLKF